jgi:hemerythrin
MSHFAFEEALIENAGYMFSGPHKKVHELFTRKVAEMQSRFDAGEDVATELHGMLSRWLFNHIRNEDHGYIDAVKAYQRMASRGSASEHERLKAEVLAELREEKVRRKGWLARLFGI